MVHGWLPGSGSSTFKACLCFSHSFSFSGGMPGTPEFRLGKTSEHALGEIGAENRLLKPVALLDLSILNFVLRAADHMP